MIAAPVALTPLMMATTPSYHFNKLNIDDAVPCHVTVRLPKHLCRLMWDEKLLEGSDVSIFSEDPIWHIHGAFAGHLRLDEEVGLPVFIDDTLLSTPMEIGVKFCVSQYDCPVYTMTHTYIMAFDFTPKMLGESILKTRRTLIGVAK